MRISFLFKSAQRYNGKVFIAMFLATLTWSSVSQANTDKPTASFEDPSQAVLQDESAQSLTDSTAKKVNKPRRTGPITIESRVKGSQEQPNVIYVMPWQGISEPIAIDIKKLKIAQPDFKPLNPVSFKRKVSQFHQTHSQTTQE